MYRSPQGQKYESIHHDLNNDVTDYGKHPIPVGTAWTLWEPAAQQSSPAHPRSWQAPSYVLAVPESARRFAHTVNTLPRFYQSNTIHNYSNMVQC
jgi:hypothetical protein